jgi:adenosylcobyric acid synthase
LRRGGRVLGICGGYQMLGRRVGDPNGIEGTPAEIEGLGLLDVETRLTDEKLLLEVSGEGSLSGAPFKGYEIHVGRTAGPDCQRPLLKLADGRTDGAMSADGLVAGCHVHGLFSDDRQRSYWMELAGAGSARLHYEYEVDAVLDALAKHLEQHLDCDGLLAMAREPRLTNAA